MSMTRRGFAPAVLLAATQLLPAESLPPTEWKRINGSLSFVTAAADGTVWGVDTNQRIVRLKANYDQKAFNRLLRGSESWEVMRALPTAASGAVPASGLNSVWLSAGSAKEIWAVNAMGRSALRWNGSAWQAANGSLGLNFSTITAFPDGSVRALSGSTPYLMTPCLAPAGAVAKGASFIDWTPHYSGPVRADLGQNVDLGMDGWITGTTANLWAMTSGKSASTVLKWNAARASWDPTGDPGNFMYLHVSADGTVLAVDTMGTLMQGEATPAPGNRTQTRWSRIAAPPRLLQAVAIDRGHIIGITVTNEVYITYAN